MPIFLGDIGMKKTLTVLALFASCAAQADVHIADSFPEAKKLLEKTYADHRIDRYCGCSFDSKRNVDLASCGYSVRKNAERASRIEIEHVVPAENLGRQFPCWQQGKGMPGGGREYCMTHDPKYMQAHNDLHNFLPVVGEVNADRSNFRYDQIPGPATQYGQCQFKVDFENRRAEPPDNLKGDVARITFYMRDTYGIRLSDQQTRLFEIWSRQDPVDDVERELDQKILKIQGNSNPYVSGFGAAHPTMPIVSALPARPEPLEPKGASGFSCATRKSCKMMTSCEEAKFQLTQCGNTRLDGDGDGIPCNALCR